MALGAVAEGCNKQMQPMLDQMVALIIPFCQDPVSVCVCCSRGQCYSVKLKGNVVELMVFMIVTVITKTLKVETSHCNLPTLLCDCSTTSPFGLTP